MLVVRDGLGDGVVRQAAKHNPDVDKTVAATVQENNGCFDVARGILDGLVEALAGNDAEGRVDFVIVELEVLVADDLEPMDHGLGARE